MILTLVLVALFAGPAAAQVPGTVHAVWNPNPATDLVTQYQITLDASTAIVSLPSVCLAGACSQIVTVPAFGAHTIGFAACNLKLSTDPTSLQCSAVMTVPFSLGSLPVVVLGAKVTN